MPSTGTRYFCRDHVFGEKYRDETRRHWEWHGYLSEQFRGERSTAKANLFSKEYDELFGDLMLDRDNPTASA